MLMISPARGNEKRKEVTVMEYRKPEIVLIGAAIETVQSTTKDGMNHEIPSVKTEPAYEADE
jgi:hypothetical protein